MIIKRKLFTKYDETDRLKQMKDSDILAEEKKKKKGVGGVIGSTLGGAIVGGSVGAGVGSLAQGASNIATSGGFKSAFKSGNITKGMRHAGIVGSTIGAIGSGLIAGYKSSKKRGEYNKGVNFYNNRLDYAQRKATRREKKDWKNNMINREGYTY